MKTRKNVYSITCNKCPIPATILGRIYSPVRFHGYDKQEVQDRYDQHMKESHK